MIAFITHQLPWIAWMIAITVQSSFAGIGLPTGIAVSDKVLHFIVFGILGLLITRGMRYTKIQFFKNRPAITAVVLGCIFALSDEVHQAFVPARSAEILDWVADFLGIVVFSYLYSRWMHSREEAVSQS